MVELVGRIEEVTDIVEVTVVYVISEVFCMMMLLELSYTISCHVEVVTAPNGFRNVPIENKWLAEV